MKKKLVNMLWAVGLLTVVSLCLPACDRELEVQQAYDFTLETMPVQKDLRRGETAEILLPQASRALCWSPLYPSLLPKRGQGDAEAG